MAAGLAFLMYPVWKSYPAADFLPAASQAYRNRQDLDYLRNLAEVDRSFTAETRAAFEQGLDELITRAADLDRAKLTMEVARLTALADNGHTNVLTRLGDSAFKSVPLRFGIFANGLFVVKASGEARDFLGTRLVSVNGRPADELTVALRPFIGRTTALLHAHAPRLIVSPELLHAAGLSDNPDRSVFRFLRANGSMVDRMLIGDEHAAPSSLVPQVDVSPTFADYAAKRDPVMDEVLKLLKTNP